MIREATIYDTPDLLRMGLAFVNAIRQEPDVVSITETLRFLMDADSAVLLISGNGKAMVGALASPAFFNRNEITAAELFWWVEPDARGQGLGIALLNGLESWARSIGVCRLSMVAMESLDASEVDMYENHGYSRFESTFVKEF